MILTRLDEFTAAMTAAGIMPPASLVADGKIHRFPTNGRRDDDAGWYVLHGGDPAVGVFGDWRTSFKQTWCSRNPDTMTKQERTAYRERMAAIQRTREEEERRRHAEAAERARQIWEAAQPAPDDHPYLVAKRIMSHGLRVTADGALIVPVCNAGGHTVSLQFIAPDGGKRFLRDGATSGGCYAIGDPHTPGPVCIAEGYATAAAIHEATGYPVIVAFSASNVVPVAKLWRAKYSDATILLCGDNDASGVGQAKAQEAADVVKGFVTVPGNEGDDWNDVYAQHGREAVMHAITEASDEAALRRLAGLSPLDYDRVRTVEARKLGVKASTLDREVGARRPCKAGQEAHGSGRILTLPETESWSEPVDGAALLSALVSVIRRHVSLLHHASVAIGLWVVWSWLIDRFDIAPRLAVLSPEKRCGKTTLLEIIDCLVPRALLVSGITPSAIFRVIEAAKPTLLIDEADTFTEGNEELRGILNSGHTRTSATIVRTVGDSFEPRAFSTWCPMVLAAIGVLPGTVEDRSIVIPMQRKAPGESVLPFPRSGRRATALRAELNTLARADQAMDR